MTATDLAGELDLDRFAKRLWAKIVGQDSVLGGGLAIVDHERDCLTLWMFARETPIESVLPQEVAHAGQTIAEYAAPVHLQRGANESPRLDEDLLHPDACSGVTAPLQLRENWLGFLFVSLAGDADTSAYHHYLQSLAVLLSPVVWNCHTQSRFQHGDKRRAALITLSDAVNRSLELETVLESTRRAMRGLSGHIYSAIMLVDEKRDAYLSYVNVEGEDPLGPPERRPLRGSLLERVLATEATYESDDLDVGRAFTEEEHYRAVGVRRCVAAPMFVRGRIIGCLLVGVKEATRVRRVDVWLYENIALQLALAIDNAQQLERVHQLSEELAQQNRYLREEIQFEHAVADMIGDSAAMRAVRQSIARVGPTTSTVLITGETGVGKELVARAIHDASPRADKPMVKVNCAAIPESMVESELFGHERGAFTSAVERRIGRFELANEGTLLLDEVGELSPSVQAKLLRVLQDGAFERVGGTETIRTNARLIAATNRDLEQSVSQGAFRSDLYYRLNVFPLHIPPLRERADEIPALVQSFIDQFNRRMGKRVEAVDPTTLADLCSRPWPGNVRELRHEVERAMIMCDDSVLRLGGATASPSSPNVPAPPVANMQEAQAAHIRWALGRTSGVIEGPNGAAALLGLKPSTLRFRMKRLGVQRPA